MSDQPQLFPSHPEEDDVPEAPAPDAPLADRLRPVSLDEVVGQQHLVGPQGVMRRMLAAGRLRSMILWGPPGTGKTTLARILCRQAGYHFRQLSAVTSGIKDLREVVAQARVRGGNTALFVDEIHRWNKAQQDAFLPHVEQGVVVLIGATTENPSFEVNGALLSRCTVYTLNRLSDEDLCALLRRALDDNERGLRANVDVAQDVLESIAALAAGDARGALNLLEMTADQAHADKRGEIDLALLGQVAQRPRLKHDKAGESHYNILSALHKSLRGSDPDAAVYWLVRILETGGDALAAARRMIAAASEDVGNADPRALQVAMAAFQAYQALGSPEGDLALTHAAVYIATAPKSNAVVKALNDARKAVAEHGDLPVPLHVRNAPTRLMKELGYGQGYQYAHDHPGAFAPQTYLPDALAERHFYEPSDRGYEKTIAERLNYWREQVRQAKE